MARRSRILKDGAFYHIRARGNRLEQPFALAADCEAFLQALERACQKTDWRVHAFCLMPDHFHLLLETPRPNLSMGMKWLLGLYAAAYNRRHRTRGHLFAGRYLSQLVEPRAPYLGAVVDHIHSNPSRAGRTSWEGLREYAWSSLRLYLMPRAERPVWLRVDRVLAGSKPGLEVSERLHDRLGAPASADDADSIADQIRQARAFGSAEFARRLQSGPGTHTTHAAGDPEQLGGEGIQKAEGLIREAMRRLRWTEPEFMKARKGDARKVAIAQQLRAETTVDLAWIAGRLKMGTPTHLSHLLYWAKRRAAAAASSKPAEAPPQVEQILFTDPSSNTDMFDPPFD